MRTIRDQVKEYIELGDNGKPPGNAHIYQKILDKIDAVNNYLIMKGNIKNFDETAKEIHDLFGIGATVAVGITADCIQTGLAKYSFDPMNKWDTQLLKGRLEYLTRNDFGYLGLYDLMALRDEFNL